MSTRDLFRLRQTDLRRLRRPHRASAGRCATRPTLPMQDTGEAREQQVDVAQHDLAVMPVEARGIGQHDHAGSEP